MSDPLVCVVILSWNQKDMTLECVKSFLAVDYPNARLLLVDNGSTDGTSGAVAQKYPQVQVVQSDRNLGIAGGYNLGIDAALDLGADYVLVTNNDVDVAPDMVTAAVSVAEADRSIGMVMPKIYHYYGDRSRLWCAGARWRSLPPSVKMIGVGARDAEWQSIQELEFAPSCTLLIRAAVLGAIGGFDEGYFFYNDDWDFSVRLRKAGYRIVFVPESHVWHKVSVSTQKSEKPARWWKTLGTSTVRFYRKHSTPLALWIYVVWFVIRETIKLKPARIPPFIEGVRESISG